MSRPVYTPFTQDDQQKPADSTIQSLLDQVKDGIVAKIGNTSELTAVHYFTRVHGAPIHYIKVLLGEDKYVHVTLTLPRFGKPGPPTLADVLLDRKADDPVEQFGLHYD